MRYIRNIKKVKENLKIAPAKDSSLRRSAKKVEKRKPALRIERLFQLLKSLQN